MKQRRRGGLWRKNTTHNAAMEDWTGLSGCRSWPKAILEGRAKRIPFAVLVTLV
jgi:hypothetical protein